MSRAATSTNDVNLSLFLARIDEMTRTVVALTDEVRAAQSAAAVVDSAPRAAAAQDAAPSTRKTVAEQHKQAGKKSLSSAKKQGAGKKATAKKAKVKKK